MELFWTTRAMREVTQAYDHIAGKSAAAATIVVGQIEDAATMLARHPHLGRVGRLEGTRELVVPVSPFIIVYRVRGGKVEILAVIHASRRWPETL